MKKIDIKNWNRQKTYEWFQTFSNSTYGMSVIMDATNLKKHTEKTKQSFFIDLLYIILTGLNSIEEFRMRLIDGEAVIFEDINPAFTVMTKSGTFENVRFKNNKNFKQFYKNAYDYIEKAKKQTEIKKENYNPENCYDEYYITSAPWINFTGMTHPIPDNKSSQCVPRICIGKYEKQKEQYLLTLNITVSHIFVDGYPLSMAFNKIQELLDQAEDILK